MDVNETERMVVGMIEEAGGKVEEIKRITPTDGFAVGSFPLPDGHWLMADGDNVPPMPWRRGKGPERDRIEKELRSAAMFAVRATTRNGKDDDYDPDAMVTNFVIGMLGYFTEDGLSSDEWANPEVTDG